MKIFSEFSNELLNRREIVAEMDFEKNPGFENAKKEIANHFKANEELIVMKSLKGKFGSDSFLIDAFVYDSVEDKEKIELKKKVKNKGGAAVAAAPQPAKK